MFHVIAAALHCANRSVNDKCARSYHMSGGFRVDSVLFLWERRYNLSSADSFPCSRPSPSRKPPRPMSCSSVRPRSTAISTIARRSSFSHRLVLSSVLFFQARFFFFFGSTTVPLAARESPLTRRMDDLRISSRSLSLVRSRYRRRSSASSAFCLFLPVFARSFFSQRLPPFP